MTTNITVWKEILDSIKKQINSPYIIAWLEPLAIRTISDTRIILEVPNDFWLVWIQKNYLEMIKNTCKEVLKKDFQVALEINTKLTEKLDEEMPTSENEAELINKNFQKKIEGSLLNKEYIFNEFIVGPSNQFAHAASIACANNPGENYNPLFIYGGVGLGKTHLVHSIGNQMIKNNPSLKICYLSAEKFMNELISCIKYDKMNEFRNKYRQNCDALLLDDVQFLAGKERTQLEFFHTFNALYEERKQIIITSDKFPKDIPTLEERLRNRFEWGLIADIQPPELETRIAILKRKAESNKMNLPDDVALYLATNIRNNIRELEGSLIRLEAYSSLTGIALSLDLAKDILKNIIQDSDKKLKLEDVQKHVAQFFNINTTELKSANKKKFIAFPRQIAMYLTRKHFNISFPEIGNIFGGRDHSTVIHAVKKIEDKMKNDKNLSVTLETIEKNLQA